MAFVERLPQSSPTSAQNHSQSPEISLETLAQHTYSSAAPCHASGNSPVKANSSLPKSTHQWMAP